MLTKLTLQLSHRFMYHPRKNDACLWYIECEIEKISSYTILHRKLCSDNNLCNSWQFRHNEIIQCFITCKIDSNSTIMYLTADKINGLCVTSCSCNQKLQMAFNAWTFQFAFLQPIIPSTDMWSMTDMHTCKLRSVIGRLWNVFQEIIRTSVIYT